MKVKLTKWGNSMAFRIPKIFVMHLGLTIGNEVDMEIKNDQIILSLPKYNLKDLVDKITPENRHDFTDWGPPAGKEIW